MVWCKVFCRYSLILRHLTTNTNPTVQVSSDGMKHSFLLFRGPWNLPCPGELCCARHHVLLLCPCCPGTCLPEVPVVEEAHDHHSAGMSTFIVSEVSIATVKCCSMLLNAETCVSVSCLSHRFSLWWWLHTSDSSSSWKTAPISSLCSCTSLACMD